MILPLYLTASSIVRDQIAFQSETKRNDTAGQTLDFLPQTLFGTANQSLLDLEKPTNPEVRKVLPRVSNTQIVLRAADDVNQLQASTDREKKQLKEYRLDNQIVKHLSAGSYGSVDVCNLIVNRVTQKKKQITVRFPKTELTEFGIQEVAIQMVAGSVSTHVAKTLFAVAHEGGGWDEFINGKDTFRALRGAIAMETTDQNMQKWLVEHPMRTRREVRSIAIQLGQALLDIHGAHIAHHALRPANIRVNRRAILVNLRDD